MPPIILIVPFLLAVFALDPTQPSVPEAVPVAISAPAPQAPAAPPVASTEVAKTEATALVAPPPVMDIGVTAFGLANEHLNSGRLASASYYFEQAARNNYRAADAYENLARIQYRLDNVEQGDRYIGLSEREPSPQSHEERATALARLKMRHDAALRLGVAAPPLPSPELAAAIAPRQAPPAIQPDPVPDQPAAEPVAEPAQPVAEAPAPAPEQVAADQPAPDQSTSDQPTSGQLASAPAAAPDDIATPGAAIGARGCKVLISSSDGSGIGVGKQLSWEGAEVDCIARENGPAPKVTTIWYSPKGEDQARLIAASLTGARLMPVLDLDNDVEVRLAQAPPKTRR